MPICLLENPIMPYAWGSRVAIGSFLGHPTPTAEPQAEVWMGAHPSAPSQVVTPEGRVSLESLIEGDPSSWLGSSLGEQRLPFLLKLLAAEQPLSLQAHPSLEQARAGFEEDERLGVPFGSPARRYKDRSHKPELLYALTPFQALCGFRKAKDSLRLLEELRVPELEGYVTVLDQHPEEGALRHIFAELMALAKAPREKLVSATVAACAGRAAAGSAFARSMAWAVKLNHLYPGDAGVVSQLLLNLVELEPGQAVFLPAGNLHAYLGGVGIELMANSDNVLRGGLTPKPVHAEELLKVLSFAPGEPNLVEPEQQSPAERVFRTPAEEFELSHVELNQQTFQGPTRSIEIWLCVEGGGELSGPTAAPLPLQKGTSAVVSADTGRVELSGTGTFFRAQVGQPAHWPLSRPRPS
jgi:mannose-6-phosphate isomerase